MEALEVKLTELDFVGEQVVVSFFYCEQTKPKQTWLF